MILCLSQTINSEMSFYKDNKRNIQSNIVDNLEKYSQETLLNIDSHTGTHIDYPAHCIKSSKFGEEYPIDYLCSKRVQMLNFDLRKKNIPKITLEFIKDEEINNDTEILFINTFYGEMRNSSKYIWESPVVDSKIPIYLKKNYPNIKAVGFDIISLTSQLDRAEGKRCHYNFLSEKEILVIEDVSFQKIKNHQIIQEVIILPFLYEKMDASPCTIMAYIK